MHIALVQCLIIILTWDPMLTTQLKSAPIPAFWWCCTGYWTGHLIAQDGTLLKAKKLTKTINNSFLFFTVRVTWFLCITWDIWHDRYHTSEVWCKNIPFLIMEFNRELPDRGLPGKQKSHKLYQFTKKNCLIEITMFLKTIFSGN